MGSGKYSVKLFIYLVSLSLLGFGFFWSFSSSQLIITKLVIGILFLVFFIFLLKYLNKTNRDLLKFLEAIKYVENISLKGLSGLSFDQLNITYNEITNQLKDAWLAKEFQHQYFQYTLENIDVGIISFDKTGKIEILNKAAKSILGIRKLNHIDNLNTEIGQIGEELKSLVPGQSKIIKLNTTIDQLHILVKSSNLKIGEKQIRLVSLQDIKTQLEQSELEAWQKLIKVLTHEIMNSVTPIKSLTYSMQKVLGSTNENKNLDESLIKGLNAIEKRSKGLLDFVESYKNLTQIQKPVYERVQIKSLVENVTQLMSKELEKYNITIKIEMNPEDISIIADEKLVTQVIVNLILNSLKALEGKNNKILKIESSSLEKNKVYIKISDNGKGISPEILDKIFVPFFSTYENGSGIGLSFARQVMVLHNGRIDVQSNTEKGTVFTLSF